MSIAVAEAMRPVQLFGGVNEEQNLIACKVVLFSQPETPLTEYKTVIRIDRGAKQSGGRTVQRLPIPPRLRSRARLS